jgi:YHS domain-containing protein
MIRLVFYAVLLILFVRAMSRLWSGIVQGFTAPASGRVDVPARGVHMVRDPVCGTFVVPERAVALSVGHEQIYFCSVSCRDKYRIGSSTSSGRPAPVEGRTA